jgi:hypothetical protein
VSHSPFELDYGLEKAHCGPAVSRAVLVDKRTLQSSLGMHRYSVIRRLGAGANIISCASESHREMPVGTRMYTAFLVVMISCPSDDHCKHEADGTATVCSPQAAMLRCWDICTKGASRRSCVAGRQNASRSRAAARLSFSLSLCRRRHPPIRSQRHGHDDGECSAVCYPTPLMHYVTA